MSDLPSGYDPLNDEPEVCTVCSEYKSNCECDDDPTIEWCGVCNHPEDECEC